MATINLYKTYSFKDKDPVIDELRTLFQDADMTYGDVHLKSNVSIKTLYSWFEGPTRRPQSATVEAVGRALGYKRTWVKFSKGEK